MKNNNLTVGHSEGNFYNDCKSIRFGENSVIPNPIDINKLIQQTNKAMATSGNISSALHSLKNFPLFNCKDNKQKLYIDNNIKSCIEILEDALDVLKSLQDTETVHQSICSCKKSENKDD